MHHIGNYERFISCTKCQRPIVTFTADAFEAEIPKCRVVAVISLSSDQIWWHWDTATSIARVSAGQTNARVVAARWQPYSNSFCIFMSSLHTSLPRDLPRPMANPWRTYHVTDISATVFSCWKGSGHRGCVVEASATFVSDFDAVSPFKDSFHGYSCLLATADCRSVRMTIIVFLVDTSASMNQRTYMGTTILDIAKGAVEHFMKVNLIFPCVILSVSRR